MPSEHLIRKVVLRGAGGVVGALCVILGGAAIVFFDEFATAFWILELPYMA